MVKVYVHDDGLGTDLWEWKPGGQEIHLDFCLIDVPEDKWAEYLAAKERERVLRHDLMQAGGYE